MREILLSALIPAAILAVVYAVLPKHAKDVIWFWLPGNLHGEPMPGALDRKVDGKKALLTALGVAVVVIPIMMLVTTIMNLRADEARLARDWNYACGDMPDGVTVASAMEEHARELEDIKTRVGGKIAIDRAEARDGTGAFCGAGLSMIVVRYERHSQVAALYAAFPNNAFHGIPVRISSLW